MINFIEYLNLPAKVALVIVIVFFVIQVIGELLEFKGKVVPEIMKIRKYFARRKQEREMMAQIPELLAETKRTLDEVNAHYSEDNITKRDVWMGWVNHQAEVYDESIKELNVKIDKNNEVTLALLIEDMRSAILDFAAYVVDDKNSVTHEQFRRIFKKYEDYEKIIEENKMTNGEVSIAIRIIRESYEEHPRNQTFVEDVQGY